MVDARDEVCGIACCGTPAPGINGVISAVVIQCLSLGIVPIGFLYGFKYLAQGITTQVRRLQQNDVTRVHNRGGSILYTSKKQLTSKKDIHNCIRALQHLQVKYLITVGGGETAFSAHKLAQEIRDIQIRDRNHKKFINNKNNSITHNMNASVYISDQTPNNTNINQNQNQNQYQMHIGGGGGGGGGGATNIHIMHDIFITHVPKTIFNDLPLPANCYTFGFSTAREIGTEICCNLSADAKTMNRWYIVTVIGALSGHLGLGIATASAATLCLVPEEFRQRASKSEQLKQVQQSRQIAQRMSSLNKRNPNLLDIHNHNTGNHAKHHHNASNVSNVGRNTNTNTLPPHSLSQTPNFTPKTRYKYTANANADANATAQQHLNITNININQSVSEDGDDEDDDEETPSLNIQQLVEQQEQEQELSETEVTPLTTEELERKQTTVMSSQKQAPSASTSTSTGTGTDDRSRRSNSNLKNKLHNINNHNNHNTAKMDTDDNTTDFKTDRDDAEDADDADDAEENLVGVRFVEVLDILDACMIKRAAYGKTYGIAVLTEGIVDTLCVADQRRYFGSVDRGHERLALVIKDELCKRWSGRATPMTFRTKFLGFELRSCDPNAHDMILSRELGYSAVWTCKVKKVNATIVTMKGGELVSIPLSEMVDPVTHQMQVKTLNINTLSWRVAQSYMIKLTKQDLRNKKLVQKLAKTANMSIETFRKTYAYIAVKSGGS